MATSASTEITVEGKTYSIVVEVNKTTYSLVEVPPEDSKLVKEQESRILGAVDLEALVGDLGRVGQFVRIAYNGVLAAGPKFYDLQAKVLDIGYGITRLCDKSAVTVGLFENASGSILSDLQCTYGYLLDNLEEMAVDTLANVSKLAGSMETAAKKLHEEFEAQAEVVKVTVLEVTKQKGVQGELIEEMDIKRQKMEDQQKLQEKLIKEAEDREKEAQRIYQECEAKEEAAWQEICTAAKTEAQLGAFHALVNGFATGVSQFGMGGLKGLFSTAPSTSPSAATQKATKTEAQSQVPAGGLVKAAEIKADKIREKRCAALETANGQRKLRHSALQKFTEFAATLVECKSQRNLADAAVPALHEAMRGLKQLSTVMMQAAIFWQQMQQHCNSLAESEMKKQVKTALTLPEEKRMKVWTSKPFKIKAVRFYAGWVALHMVCTRYVEQIKLTRKDLYEIIKENLTYEEAGKLLPKLAKKFMADVEAAQQDIVAQTTAATNEIKALTAPPPSDAK